MSKSASQKSQCIEGFDIFLIIVKLQSPFPFLQIYKYFYNINSTLFQKKAITEKGFKLYHAVP